MSTRYSSRISPPPPPPPPRRQAASSTQRDSISYNPLIELPPIDISSSSSVTTRSSTSPNTRLIAIGKVSSSSSSSPGSSSSASLSPPSASILNSRDAIHSSSSTSQPIGKPSHPSSSISTSLSFLSSDEEEEDDRDLASFFPSSRKYYPPSSSSSSTSSSSSSTFFSSFLHRRLFPFCKPFSSWCYHRGKLSFSRLRTCRDYLVKNILSAPVSVLLTSDRETSRVIFFTFLYAFLHGATDQLLPAAYKTLESQLHFSPTILGTASSLSRLAHAISCPLWGITVDAVSTPEKTLEKNRSANLERRKISSSSSTAARTAEDRGVFQGRGGQEEEDEEEEDRVGRKRKERKKKTFKEEEEEEEELSLEDMREEEDEAETGRGDEGKASERRRGEIGILQLSCWGWGVCTLLLACIHREWHLMPLMLSSGFLMAVMGPVTQKILGEALPSDKRGSAFGSMSFFQSLGRMSALLFTTSLSDRLFFRFIAVRKDPTRNPSPCFRLLSFSLCLVSLSSSYTRD